MKWILKIFLLSILTSFASMTYAADAKDNYVSINPIANQKDLQNIEGKCATVSYNGVDVVNPKDFSICSNDISYGILEIMFQKVFSENPILTTLAEDTDSVSTSSYAYNIGGPIIAVIESVTWLTFIISGIIVTYITIKTLTISATSGQFMSNWSSVYLITRTLFAIAVIVPIGSFSLSQIMVLIFAMFAIMGANYIWGSFLSMQQSSTVVLNDKSDSQFYIQSSQQAETMVKMNTCALRSSAASVEINQGNVESTSFFHVDVDDHFSRLSSCSRNNMFVAVDQDYSTTERKDPAEIMGGARTSTGNVFPISTYALGSPTTCKGFSDVYFNQYDKEMYGDTYQCGNVTFQTASLNQYVTNHEDIEKEGFFDKTETDVIKTISAIKSQLPPNELYMSVRMKGYENSKSGKIFLESDYTSDIEKLKSVLSSNGTSLFKNVTSYIDSDTTNPPLAYDATYVAMSAAFNNYLGGTYSSSGYDSFIKKLLSLDINISSDGLSVTMNKAVQIETESESGMEMSLMYNDAKIASAYLISAQCASNWGNYISAFDSSKNKWDKYIKNKDENMKDQKIGGLSTNCIIPGSLSEKSIDSSSIGKIYTHLNQMKGEKTVYYISLADSNGERATLLNMSNGEISPETAKAASESLKNANIKEAKAIIAGMSAYNYVVREATKQALEEVFVKEVDEEFFVKMRALGWASAGGFILNISKNSTDINKYNSLIQSQVGWSANTPNNQYIDSSVLARKTSGFSFTTMEGVTSLVFANSTGGDYTNLNEKSSVEISSTAFFSFLEDLLTAPLSRLKDIGGFDQNETLRDGAKKCYESGDCTITDVHPVTALLAVGNDLIDLCFNLLILKAITGTLALMSVQNQLGVKGTAGSNEGMMTKMLSMAGKIPFLAVLGTVASMIDPFLGIICTTVLPPLFIVGIFFSFVVPMMPYLAFLIGFIGWVMLILELLIAVNVWMLMMATPDQNGNSRADPRALFGFTGQLLLKPGLMVVALVFGWYLSAISIYFLNMTIFGALSPTDTGSFFGILDMFMFYVVYLIMVFIAIKHSFKIIEILPDKIFGLINISKSTDIKSDSLGMERLVQLAAGEKVYSLAKAPVDEIDRQKEKAKSDLERYQSNEQSNLNDMVLQQHQKEDSARKKVEEAMNGTETLENNNINEQVNNASQTETNPDGSNATNNSQNEEKK